MNVNHYSGPSHLNKDCEEDNSDDGSEKQVLHSAIGQKEPQGESNCPSQATISNNELILFRQLHNTELIYDECQANHS